METNEFKKYKPEELTPYISAKKQQERKLKLATHRLRYPRRLMKNYDNEINRGRLSCVPAQHKILFDRWKTGALDQELDKHTMRHGFGRLRNQLMDLGPRGL